MGFTGFFSLDVAHHEGWTGFSFFLHDGQVTQHGVIELERMLNFFHHSLAGFDVDAEVVGFGKLLDQVHQLATAPIFHTMHSSAAGGNHAFVAFQHGWDLLALIRVDQQDDLVMTHNSPFG